MSKILIALIVFWMSQTSVASPRDVIPVSLEQVAREVSERNYYVLENAKRVYQAKETVQFARRGLLPKLNLWKIVGAVVEPASIIGMVEDIAPFLVPNNWFRVKEEKLLFEAQTHAYRALRANEVLTAKALFVNSLLDESLYGHLERTHSELRALLDWVRVRETVGGTPQKLSREIEVQCLGLEDDMRGLGAVVREDKNMLGFMLGMPAHTEVSLVGASLPDFESLSPWVYADLEPKVIDASPEVQQFTALVQVAKQVKKERIFSFLGTSSASRGVMGGIFDNLPYQDGLGFGMGPSIRIAKAEMEILEIQRQAVGETILRSLQLLVYGFNEDLKSYRSLKRRVELTTSIVDSLYDRIHLGDFVEIADLVVATRNRIEADTAFFAIQYRVLIVQDRLRRLMFEGDYAERSVLDSHH